MSHQCRQVTLQIGASLGSSAAVICTKSEVALKVQRGSASLLVVAMRNRWTHEEDETLSPE